MKEEPRESEKLVALIGHLGTILISTKVVGGLEPSVFKTKELSLVLDRQTPSMLARKHLQWNGGSSGVFFPSRKVLTQNSPLPLNLLDAQVSTRPPVMSVKLSFNASNFNGVTDCRWQYWDNLKTFFLRRLLMYVVWSSLIE